MNVARVSDTHNLIVDSRKGKRQLAARDDVSEQHVSRGVPPLLWQHTSAGQRDDACEDQGERFAHVQA